MKSTSITFLADEPLLESKQDTLHREHIVNQLVDLVKDSASTSSSSVIALSGAWGSGKTSLINFAKLKLKSEFEDPKSVLSGAEIVDYSPWLLIDINSLLMNFFSAIQDALPVKKSEKARRHLSKYANGLASVSKVAALAGVPDASGAFGVIGKAAEGKVSLDKTKEKVNQALEKLSHKIIVIIDDLDRLHPDELLLVFKLIRSVARFPNVYYLLSFDELTILDLLSSTSIAQGDRARATAYIEKIVQSKIDVPPLHETHHQEMFAHGLQAVTKKTGLELSEAEVAELYRLYVKYLSPWLTTPRSIRRMFSQLLSSCGMVHGEVNFNDFFLINFLRTFEPATYQSLVGHKDLLTGRVVAWDFEKKMTSAEAKEFWGRELDTLKVSPNKVSAVMAVLGLLFSGVKSALSGNSSKISNDILRFEKRIESNVYFDRYFQLAIPYGDVSDQAIKRGLIDLLASKVDSDDVASLSLAMGKFPFVTLQKMRIIVSNLEGNTLAVVDYVSKKYEDLPEDREFIIGSSSDELEYLVWDLLNKSGPTEAGQIIAMISGTENRVLSSRLESRISQIEEKPAWYELLRKKVADMLAGEVAKMKSVALGTVSNDEFMLFCRWARIVGDNEARAWARENIETGKWKLSEYLGHLVRVVVSYGYIGKIRRIDDWEKGELEKYVEIDWAIQMLGDKLNQEYPPLDELKSVEPTLENRVAYALAIMARHKLGKVGTSEAANSSHDSAM